MQWITKGFEDFSKGTFENGGQNLYVSRKGVLQRIFHYDINLDGYPDLLFANSQSMYERAPVYVYEQLPNAAERYELPTNGAYAARFADLHGTGFQDLIIACQNDGQHSDIASIIYFGSEKGLTEKYKMELPAPNATDIAVGDFNGDGKKEIMFVCHNKLRMFYQKGRGFGPAHLIDYDIPAAYIASADFDGDGIADLAVKDPEGRVYIYFGTENGLDTQQPVELEGVFGQKLDQGKGSTAGFNSAATQWRPAFIHINGVQYLYVMQDEHCVLYTCSKARQLKKAMVLHCPNAVGVAAADLNGDGYEELAIAVYKDRDEAADCRLYIGGAQGINPEQYEQIPVVGAVAVVSAFLDGNKIIFSRIGESVEKEVPCPVFDLDESGKVRLVTTVMGGDCSSVAVGKPDGSSKNDTVVMCNHMLNRGEGHEKLCIYLGGEDGYTPERKVEFYGHSAVEGQMIDIRDVGVPDVLVANCYEDAYFRDHGCYIYENDGTGNLQDDRKSLLPTVRCHGFGVGDFRKSGYLDIATGGVWNREIVIFHGSENGYSADNCTRILLGEQTPEYKPTGYLKNKGWQFAPGGDTIDSIIEYGNVRWLFAADFNGDGWLDLFVSQITGPSCMILWGGPDGFSAERMTQLQADGVASANVADLDGDGYPELILAQHQSTKKKAPQESYVTVYWGGPEGYREDRKMQLPTSCSNSVTVGDFSGKGKLDIYATAYRTNRCRDVLSHIYENDGQGNFSIKNVKYLFNHSGSACVAGDFNGDGYTDLAVACHKEYGNHESHSFVFWGGPDGLSDDRKTVLPTTGPHGMCTVDPGNVVDRGPKEHYTSEAKELPAGAIVKRITWEGECTSTSWVEVEMRCAKDEKTLENTPWKPVESGAEISELGLSGVIQYRLSLCANCSCGTPRITAVEVEY